MWAQLLPKDGRSSIVTQGRHTCPGTKLLCCMTSVCFCDSTLPSPLPVCAGAGGMLQRPPPLMSEPELSAAGC